LISKVLEESKQATPPAVTQQSKQAAVRTNKQAGSCIILEIKHDESSFGFGAASQGPQALVFTWSYLSSGGGMEESEAHFSQSSMFLNLT
jgi:hypothetical protein